MSFAIKQLSTRILNPDHLVIDAAPELKVKFSQVSQVYTVLPNANHQLPYLVKLLAHDQLKYPRRSKVVVFCTTTRMAQLLTRLVETSRAMCLPAGESTSIYSLHPLVAIQDRATSISDFIENKGCSVLITADINLQTTPLRTTTRIIQFGVPSSDPVYYSRVQQAAQSPTRDKRVDLVLLPWQTGYLTCNLMDAPLSPVDIEQFHKEMAKLAEKADMKSLVDGIEDKVQALLPNLPEEEILSAFVSLLGYYVPRCNDLRAQRSTVVRGITDWATGACRLLRAPFISEDYLNRLQELDKVKG
jgi:ATP-dependent RNA helicase MSS116, mitochondrial